ncbi:MAG TPA: hypothetical protein VG407_16020 [Caulobacteraceae bacterium]|jgi:hypothetical protein|nr:hypothetical protein [Caulobacteraceae bacterium]
MRITSGLVGGLIGGLIGTLTLAAAATALAAAPAAAPTLDKAFQGTIISTYPDGRKAELWMRRDGTFTSEGRRHDRHTGTWSVRGAKVCFKRGIFSYCTAVPTNDAEFTTKAVTGETIRVRLVPGRSGEHAG